jgi:crossover junction endodeoxyribonuclease RusA
MTMVEFLIPNTWWLTANGRYHWAERAKRTRNLRDYANWTARALQLQPAPVPAIVTTHVQYPTNTRADPSNTAPTIKALIDGLVDAHIFIDDNHQFVIDGGYRRLPGRCKQGHHLIQLTIQEAKTRG